jgi:hypothetical protein
MLEKTRSIYQEITTAQGELPRHITGKYLNRNPLNARDRARLAADGRIGELFLNNHKCGNQSDTNARDAAILLSFAIQYGADITVIRRALCRDSKGQALSPVGAALDLLAEQAP